MNANDKIWLVGPDNGLGPGVYIDHRPYLLGVGQTIIGIDTICDEMNRLSDQIIEQKDELATMTERAQSAEKQLADLRGDRDTLAGEVKARRLPNGKTDEEHGKRWHTVQSAIEAVNASGALTRAGVKS